MITSVFIATRILGILRLSYCFFFMLVEVEASLQREALLQDYLYGCLRFYMGVCTHPGSCLWMPKEKSDLLVQGSQAVMCYLGIRNQTLLF